MRIHRAAMFVAGSMGLMLVASPSAFAQCGAAAGYGGNEPPKENVTVTAPRIQRATIGFRPTLLNTTIGSVSFSSRVSYADLDLCTPEGASELRARVRKAAADGCDMLVAAYPHGLIPGVSCYRAALNNAMPKANSAIAAARNP